MNNMLQVQFGNITFQNPVIAASGTFSPDFEQHFDLSRLGGICSKGLTLYPRAGNKGIRIWETASGIMNSVGLENKGVDLFIQQDLPILKKLKDKGVRIIINVSGSTEEEYLRAVELFSKEEVDIIELNILPKYNRGRYVIRYDQLCCPRISQAGKKNNQSALSDQTNS